jgi:shikimate dehydrogenase
VTDRAALIGAANTLIFRKDGKIHADNTDGSGFIANLRQNAPHWAPAPGPAVVFGAGGAARAVVAALIEVGVPEIRIANRTRARAEACGRISGPRCMSRMGAGRQHAGGRGDRGQHHLAGHDRQADFRVSA